ncbi:MAG: hypothetical protein DRN57_02830 [Thermoplasmata archaeon]|nr:MAG: hypothetical protein DRN57_02830 [Thermoplasmata archaeon]
MSGGFRGISKWWIPVIMVGIVIIAFLFYQWIIPRTNLEVRTVYHESPGGGGTGGVINVNVLLTNWGNREISDLDCRVVVDQVGGGEMARNEAPDLVLGRGENAEIKLSFIGSQFADYKISISLSMICSGSTTERVLVHETEEEQMNLVFVDNLR